MVNGPNSFFRCFLLDMLQVVTAGRWPNVTRYRYSNGHKFLAIFFRLEEKCAVSGKRVAKNPRQLESVDCIGAWGEMHSIRERCGLDNAGAVLAPPS